jgi:hypothetical protein
LSSPSNRFLSLPPAASPRTRSVGSCQPNRPTPPLHAFVLIQGSADSIRHLGLQLQAELYNGPLPKLAVGLAVSSLVLASKTQHESHNGDGRYPVFVTQNMLQTAFLPDHSEEKVSHLSVAAFFACNMSLTRRTLLWLPECLRVELPIGRCPRSTILFHQKHS